MEVNSLSERQQIRGPAKSGYLWCLHCERTYADGEFREVRARGETYQMCPYSDCDGDAVMDAWDWGTVREHRPEYVTIPEHRVTYPLYG